MSEEGGTEVPWDLLVSFEGNAVQFHADVLKWSLLAPQYANRKKTVVSIMGPSRSGKSFALSFLTRTQDKVISGNFQTGYSRCTQGILIRRAPVEVNGCLIFYLDTQGTFDLETERNVSAWIGVFSLLLADIQILNLRGNVEADKLQDLHLFTEIAKAFEGAVFPKKFLFLIRDSPYPDQDTEFLQNLFAQCELASDLKQISAALHEKFGNEMYCVCAPMANQHLRVASGSLVLQREDQPFIKKLAKVQSYIETWSQDIYATKDYLELGMKVADFLTNKAPQIGASTVQVIREASILVAVNKTLEVFLQKIKNTTYEAFHHDCGTAEKEGLEKVHKMVKASDFEEAAALFREKSKEIATGKFYELKAAEDERLGQQISGQFLSSEMEKITSITDVYTLLDMTRQNAAARIPLNLEISEIQKHELAQKIHNFIVARYEQMRNLQLNFVVANADRDMRIEMEKEVSCGVEIQPAAANAQRLATSNLQNALEQLGFEPGTVVKIREKTAEHLENTAQSLAERFVADRESKSKLEKLQADYEAHTKREIALAMEPGQRPDEESDVESDITEIERYEDLLEDPQTQYHPDISALPSQAWHVQPSPPSAYAPPSNPEPQGSRQKTTPMNNYGTLGPAIENSIPQKHEFPSRAQELEEAKRHSIDPLQAGRDEMWRELAILKHCYEKGDVRDEATAKYLSDQCLKRCNAFWNLKGYEGMDLLALEGELEAAIVRLEQRPPPNVAATKSSYNRSSIIATVLAMLAWVYAFVSYRTPGDTTTEIQSESRNNPSAPEQTTIIDLTKAADGI